MDPVDKKEIIKLLIIAFVFSIVTHVAAYLIYLKFLNN